MRCFRPIVVVSLLSVASLAAPGRREPSTEAVLRQYIDREGFNWNIKKTKNFQLYFETETEARRQLDKLRRNVEDNRKAVLRLMGEERYDPTIHAFLVESGSRMKELVGVSVDGRSRPHQHAIFSVVTPERLHLTHEICHEISSNLWGAAEHWIEEGFATFAQEGSNVYFDSWDLMRSGELIPLERIVRPDWTTTMYSPDVTYPQLGAFVKFLHDRHGMARLKQAWQGGSASIEQVYGKTLAQLESDWLESLAQQFPIHPTRHYRRGAHGFFMD